MDAKAFLITVRVTRLGRVVLCFLHHLCFLWGYDFTGSIYPGLAHGRTDWLEGCLALPGSIGTMLLIGRYNVRMNGLGA